MLERRRFADGRAASSGKRQYASAGLEAQPGMAIKLPVARIKMRLARPVQAAAAMMTR